MEIAAHALVTFAHVALVVIPIFIVLRALRHLSNIDRNSRSQRK